MANYTWSTLDRRRRHASVPVMQFRPAPSANNGKSWAADRIERTVSTSNQPQHVVVDRRVGSAARQDRPGQQRSGARDLRRLQVLRDLPGLLRLAAGDYRFDLPDQPRRQHLQSDAQPQLRRNSARERQVGPGHYCGKPHGYLLHRYQHRHARRRLPPDRSSIRSQPASTRPLRLPIPSATHPAPRRTTSTVPETTNWISLWFATSRCTSPKPHAQPPCRDVQRNQPHLLRRRQHRGRQRGLRHGHYQLELQPPCHPALRPHPVLTRKAS